MKVAMLSPIAWRTPPRKYGPWEQVTSVLTEALVKKGADGTLFATGDSITCANLEWICPTPYGDDRDRDAKVWECLHISALMEQAANFDVIHNHFDFLPLTYSRLTKVPMVTTIHGLSSEKILPVYKKYNLNSSYISISDADRHPDLKYMETVYHGIDSELFTLRHEKQDYLLFYGRIHPDKGTHTAIQLAKKCGRRLKIAGLIQDQEYYIKEIAPNIDNDQVTYLGNVSPQEGSSLLGQAAALLHLITFEEPFGLSVAESSMCGTPVIAFRRGSMPELIENGKTGFLVNTIDQAVHSVARLHQIDPNYCRTVAMQKFSVDEMAERYFKIYRKLSGAI